MKLICKYCNKSIFNNSKCNILAENIIVHYQCRDLFLDKAKELKMSHLEYINHINSL